MDTTIKNVKLKDYKLNKDGDYLYLSLVYQYERPDGIHELHIPKIDLGIYNEMPDIEVTAMGTHVVERTARFGNASFYSLKEDVMRVPDELGIYHTITAAYADCLVEERPTEMTLSEIEKKLGHKIKIVNEKVKGKCYDI